MTGNALTLLDEADTSRRVIQHGAVFLGVAVLVVAFAVASRSDALFPLLGLIGIAIVLFAAAASVDQRWEARYKGHVIRFQNNPFRGEALFIDERPAGRGRLGYRSRIEAIIPEGEGAGDRIVAQSEAGLVTFRCRIVAEPPQTASASMSTASNEELLAELRRRGVPAGDR